MRTSFFMFALDTLSNMGISLGRKTMAILTTLEPGRGLSLKPGAISSGGGPSLPVMLAGYAISCELGEILIVFDSGWA